MYTNHRQHDWPEWLVLSKFSYNNKVNKSTGYSLFMLVYGQDPEIGASSHQEVQNESAKEFIEFMSKMQEEAESLLIQANDNVKGFYD